MCECAGRMVKRAIYGGGKTESDGGMKINRIAVLTNGFCRNSFEYTVKTIQEAGIGNMVLWGGVSHCYPKYAGGGQLRKVERVIRETGVKFIAMYPETVSYPFNLASREEVIRRRTMDYYSVCIEFCDEVRIPAIIFHPGFCLLDQDPNEALRYGAEGISLLAGLAAGKGITPLLLHGAANYAKGCRGTAELLNAADHTALKAELDLAQLLKDQETVGDAVRYFGGKMGLARISDGPDGHLAVGDGVWPLKEVCGQLFDSGYSGPVALQFDSRNYVADPRTALFSCMKEIWSW